MPGPVATPDPLPDPAVVVLIGASGSGKSYWAAAHYRPSEIVSSDALRAAVGSGPGDLDASADAFRLLDQIVSTRLGRGLTTVIDTLGLDRVRRQAYLAMAQLAGLPAVAVLCDTAPGLCRRRNGERNRPVPSAVITNQLRAVRAVREQLVTEGWDEISVVEAGVAPVPPPVRKLVPDATPGRGFRVVLQLSRFPWGEDPVAWLSSMARTAAEIGFEGLALMDHLIQIPQVDRAWAPVPEPWVTLGLLAGLDTGLRLGTLVSPASFRAPGVIAKAAATLDVLSGGRAFCGLGAGWWEREHRAYGLPFGTATERLDQLQRCIETMQALRAPGTKPYAGRFVDLPETTCYPRPLGPLPIIVGGSGERRTLRIVAEQADGCNLPSSETTLAHKLPILRQHCAAVGRDMSDVEVTVLDVAIVGRDREDAAQRVERLRGRTAAVTFAARHHAGTPREHRERYRRLAELGVRTVFLALPDLAGPDDLHRCAELTAALR